MQALFAHVGKLTAVLLMLTSGISWWLAPGPEPARRAQSRDEAWVLPVATTGHTGKSAEKSVTTVSAANLWGAVQKMETQELLIAPEWRFSGVTVNGQDKLVMITVAGQTMQTLKVGEQLPGGARILGINDDNLCVLIKGKKRKLDIF